MRPPHRIFGIALCALILQTLLLCPSPATAEDSGQELRMIFTSSGYMPFYSDTAGATALDYDGAGMLVDLLRIFENAHPEYEFRHLRLPRSRANAWFRQGQADIYVLQSDFFAGIAAEHYAFSIPLWHTADLVYTLQGSTLRYSCPDDLCGVPTGIICGYGYGPLDPLLRAGDIPSTCVGTDRQLYRLLLDGRVQAIVANRHVLSYSMYRYGLNPLRVRAAGPPVYEFDLSVMVRKDRPEILDALNAFIRESRESGLMDDIARRWLGADGFKP
ncbi:MAG: substrate-binding periplasmic protein [Desulfovibrio sp.]